MVKKYNVTPGVPHAGASAKSRAEALRLDKRFLTKAEAPTNESLLDDPVNHPPHYETDGVECIDALAAALGPTGFKDYLRGQVLRYLWRAERKGAAEEDLRKAQWYLDRLVGVAGPV